MRSNQLVRLLDERVNLSVIGFSRQRMENDLSAQLGDRLIRLRSQAGRSAKLLGEVVSPFPQGFVQFESSENRAAIKKAILTCAPDVVHLDSFGLAGQVRWLENQTTLLHIHDACSKKYPSWLEASKSVVRTIHLKNQHRKVAKFERDWLPKAGISVVDSPEDADYLRQTTGANVEVVSLGFDPKQYSSEGLHESLHFPSLVFSGSMGSVQSTDGAVRLITQIMPNVWNSQPDVHVYLVGGNPSPEVVALSERRVHVTGFVPELSDYLRGATAYVCPLYVGGGMRTRLVEALACGCAAVATENASLGLSYDENRQRPWLIAEEPEAFAAEISKLLTQEKQRNQLKSAAAQYAHRRYSWNATAERLMAIYQSLVSASAPTIKT